MSRIPSDKPVKPSPEKEKPGQTPPSQITIQTKSMGYSGPVPHPELLKAFEEILPGSADRIFAMAEKEQTNRHENEKLKIKSSIRLITQGQIFAFILTLAGLSGSIYITLQDKDIQGYAYFFATLITVLTAYLLNRKDSKTKDE